MGVPRVVLGVIFVSFDDSGYTFLIFEGVGSKLAIIGFFRRYSECLQGHGGDITRG
jgi:hypothetical protein